MVLAFLVVISQSICFPMDKLQVRMQYRQAMAAAAEHQKMPATALMNLGIYRVYARRLRDWSKGTLSDDFDACSFDIEDGDVQLEEYEELLRENVKNVPGLEQLLDRTSAPSDTEPDTDENVETENVENDETDV